MHPAEHDIRLLEHRNKAIADLFTSKEFNDCINKMEPAHLRDDLKQEVVLALMEKEPAMIIGLQERGELKWFVVRIIITMVTGSKSTPFVKLYRKHFEEFNIDHPAMNQPDFPINGRVVRELREQAVQYYIKHELYWYDRAIMELYMKHGSYRKIEEETRIPWESCYSTVRKCITRIRKEVLNVSE